MKFEMNRWRCESRIQCVAFWRERKQQLTAFQCHSHNKYHHKGNQNKKKAIWHTHMCIIHTDHRCRERATRSILIAMTLRDEHETKEKKSSLYERKTVTETKTTTTTTTSNIYRTAKMEWTKANARTLSPWKMIVNYISMANYSLRMTHTHTQTTLNK